MEESQKRNLKTQYPAVYQQSLYIAALDRYMNIKGLISSWKDNLGYSFDFLQPKRQRSIKIFKNIENAEVERYANHPHREIIEFIVDVTGRLKGPGRFYIQRKNLPKAVVDAAVVLNASLFVFGRLFKPTQDFDGGVAWTEIPDEYEKGVKEGYDRGYQTGHMAAIIEIKFRDRNAA